MKKVAIVGADTPDAGELIRLLIFHPDVELVQFVASEYIGQKVSAVHHGLIAEIDATFQGSLSMQSVDVVIYCGPMHGDINDFQTGSKMIWIPPISQPRVGLPEEILYGQPEANRKPLVRGARAAVVPSPIASVFIASMLPLLQILPQDVVISAQVSLPVEVFNDTLSESQIETEIMLLLKSLRPNFNANLNLTYLKADAKRGAEMKIMLNAQIPIVTALKKYGEIYDDHNFSHVISEPVGVKEVEGTEKCLITLAETSGGLLIKSVADVRMRGGAGEGVHLLNLLFGLQERVGLMLKVSEY